MLILPAEGEGRGEKSLGKYHQISERTAPSYVHFTMKDQIRILLVEDEPSTRDLIRLTLKKAIKDIFIHDVDTRTHFHEALETRSYDLILTDYQLGTFTGLDIIDDVRERDLNIPIIMVTGTGTEEIAVEAMKRGIDDYVLKSRNHIKRLPMTVEHVLERAGAQRLNREAMEALQKSERLLQESQHVAHMGSWEWDTVTNKTYWSEGHYRLFGITAEEHGGTFEAFLERIHPEDRASLMAKVEAIMSTGEDFRMEYRPIVPGGEIRYHLSQGKLFFDEDRKPMRMVGTAIDITERKKIEMELHKYQAGLEDEVSRRTTELEVVNKDLQAFAHSVSHDLKAPLRAIEGFADILREDYRKALDEAGHEILSEISHSAVRMGEMVDDLLAHAEMGQGFTEVTNVDLNTVLEKVKRDLAHDIQERDVKISIDGKLSIVTGHQATLEALMQNLISNAIKYVEPEKQPDVLIRMSETDEEYIIDVKDNGIGIEKDYQDKIYGIFERLHTKEEFPGTGVGLATVEKAVQLHNGRLWLESEVGSGSTFHFSIAKNL